MSSSTVENKSVDIKPDEKSKKKSTSPPKPSGGVVKKNEEAVEHSAKPKDTEKKGEREAESPNETNVPIVEDKEMAVDETDIKIVMLHTKCTYAQAREALIEHKGDIFKAVEKFLSVILENIQNSKKAEAAAETKEKEPSVDSESTGNTSKEDTSNPIQQ